MGVRILSGAGNGAEAVITDDGRLNTSSRVSSRFYFQSRVGNRAFSWAAVTAALAANDTALLVKNTNTALTLVIHAISFSGDTTGEWIIHRPTTNVTVAGTSVTGVNLNGNFGAAAEASAAADETGNTRGDILYSTRLLANTPHLVDQEMIGDAIRLGTNQSIAVDTVASQGAFSCVIAGYYETDSKVAA